MEAKVYNQTGKETGKISLPENVFGLSWDTKAEKLVDQVVKSMLNNERTPIAHTKTRGEVSGTGIKPWKQKGTGRARHGSRRSPIWVGGGIAHGPRNERDYSVKINKKMKTKALFVVLSKKFKDGEVLFLNEISLKAPKTKEAKEILNSIAKIDNKANINRKKNAAFITTVGKNDNLSKSFRNFGNLEIGEVKDLNAVDLLRYRYCVVTEPEKAIATLAARLK